MNSHASIISIEYRVYSKMKTGELSGAPSDYGQRQLLIEADDKDSLLKKINEGIDTLKSTWGL